MSDVRLTKFFDDGDELEFGELPDDNSANEENDFDANNDVTFGEVVVPSNDEELADYAAQTACLRLDDWDLPSGSEAPDPSQLPIPSFLDTSVKLDGLFSSDPANFSSIWGETTNLLSSWDKIPPSLSELMGKQEVNTQYDFDKWKDEPNTIIQPVTKPSTSESSGVPAMPKAMTVEELENSHMKPAKVPMPSQAMSAEDLERRMLQESAVTMRLKAESAQQADTSQVAPRQSSSETSSAQRSAPNYPIPPQGPGFPPIPGFIPAVPPMILQYIPVWMEYLCRRLPYLPPNVPPVPPILAQLLHRYNDPRMAVAAFLHPPPIPPNFQGPHPPMPRPQHSHMGGMQRKPPGMPSGKTIEDLAFDQFAGFMSCKERQWLVKIQLIQCQGATNNSYNDDYYYECWRRKRIAEGVQPTLKPSKGVEFESKEQRNGRSSTSYKHQRERNGSSHQNEPREKENKFAGSLGIPSKSTTANPRHSIKVGTPDSLDEEHEKKTANTQKRLRTLLLRIEAATTTLIECQDLIVSVQMGTPGVTREHVQTEIASRVHMLLRELFTDDLLRVLQIAKGRQLICRIVKFAGCSEQAYIINRLFSLSAAHKKNTNDHSSSVVPHIYSVLKVLNRDQLVNIISLVNAQAIVDSIDDSILARDLLIALLLLSCTKKATSASPVFQWLRSPSQSPLSGIWHISMDALWASFDISRDDVLVLAEWLQLLVTDSKQSTVASQISSILVAAI